MVRKLSAWLVIWISIVAIAFIVAGCAKKQVVKEEAAVKPAVQAKKEEGKAGAPPAPATPKEEAKVEAPAPAPAAPKEEAKPEAATKAEEKPASIDLQGLRIQFAFDDYNLSNKSKKNLEKIASWMPKNPPVKIQVEGHTCDIGTAEYNLALGDRRATSAKKYLEGLGVDTANLSTISYGEEKPRVPNTDEAHRSMNRRDEFVMK